MTVIRQPAQCPPAPSSASSSSLVLLHVAEGYYLPVERDRLGRTCGAVRMVIHISNAKKKNGKEPFAATGEDDGFGERRPVAAMSARQRGAGKGL